LKIKKVIPKFISKKQDVVNRKIIQTPMMKLNKAESKILANFFLVKNNFKKNENSKINFEFIKNPYNIRSKFNNNFIIYAQTGHLNQSSFKIIMDKVVELWKLQFQNLNLYLIGDNSSCHTRYKTMIELLYKDVYLLFLPPHTTHKNQPLDSYPFSIIKKNF